MWQRYMFFLSEVKKNNMWNRRSLYTLGWQTRRFFKQSEIYEFMEVVLSSKVILDPQKLPLCRKNSTISQSTGSLTRYIRWKKLSSNNLDPKQWGWKLKGSVFTPIMTDLDAALDSVLKFVWCKYKLSSKNPCNTTPTCALIVEID